MTSDHVDRIFSYIKGVIMTEWVPKEQTVNQNYYLQVLTALRQRVKNKAA